MAVALLGGCTGLEPAALSAGASVAQTGVTIFDRGKAKTMEFVRIEDATAALRRVVNLSLTEISEDVQPGRVRMELCDDHRDTIVVVLERRTATMTHIQGDVGTFGDIGYASLVVKQILTEIAATHEGGAK
jgi:hypothetical protein